MSISNRTKFILNESLSDQVAGKELTTAIDAASALTLPQALASTSTPTFAGVKVGLNTVIGAQQSAISVPTVTYTTAAPGAANGATTIADGSAPTVAELLDFVVELQSVITNLRNALRTHGLIAP